MIVFSGRVDHELKKKILKQRDRQVGWLGLGSAGISGICTVIFSILDKSVNYKLLIPTIIIIALSVLFLIAPQPSNSFRVDWNYTVTIDNGKIHKVQLQQPDIIKEVKKIKKVIDNGKYYTVIYSGLSNAIICQKNLLVEGTLEEFEAIFEGKIKRKFRGR